MSVLTVASANTFRGTGFGEHISRLADMLMNIAYIHKRKHKCSSSSLEYFADISVKGQCTMLFLLTAFALESDCKNTHFFSFDQIYFNMVVSKKADRKEEEPNDKDGLRT